MNVRHPMGIEVEVGYQSSWPQSGLEIGLAIKPNVI